MTNSIFKSSVWVVTFILIVINVFVFVNSMKLGDEVNFYESEISKLHLQNLELAKIASSVDSLQFASSKAAEMNFTNKETPLFLDNLKYALNR